MPARDEEVLAGACLEALAAQAGIAPDEYEVLLVLDRCTDGTERRAREVAAAHPEMRLYALEGRARAPAGPVASGWRPRAGASSPSGGRTA